MRNFQMTVEILSVIVLVNLLLTLWMWQKRSGGPKKKLYWDLATGASITPNHQRPNAIGERCAGLVQETDRQFFDAFHSFGDVVNWWLADEHVGSRWRLQELATTELTLGSGDDPEFGRRYEVYCGPKKLGTLEVAANWDYHEKRNVRALIGLQWVRLLQWETLSDFLGAIAIHICDGDQSSQSLAQGTINTALAAALWNSQIISSEDFGEAVDWGNLEVTFRGNAPFYFSRRNSEVFQNLRSASF
jgi:hypothetical protein